MVRYFLKRIVIFIVLATMVYALSYFMYDENAEHALSEMAQTVLVQALVIPLTLLLLLIDSYVLRRRGKKWQFRVSMSLSFIVFLFAVFVVLRFIVGVI